MHKRLVFNKISKIWSSPGLLNKDNHLEHFCWCLISPEKIRVKNRLLLLHKYSLRVWPLSEDFSSFSLQGKDHIAHTANKPCLFLQIDVAFNRQKLIQTELRTNKIKSPFIVQQNNTDIKPLKPGHNSWTDGRTAGSLRPWCFIQTTTGWYN